MDFLFLILGLVLVLVGANGLTDGAASVAKRFKISNLVIGLTIVAFGTSAPEFTVSLISSINGNSEIAIGNVVGSNIFNTLMIIGATALVMPISVGKGTLTRELPLCILASVVLSVCAFDTLFASQTTNVLSRGDGIVMLCFFAIFLGYTFAIAKNGNDDEPSPKEMSVFKSTLYIVLGLVALVAGGRLFVDGASGIARMMGVSESVIGLTLVAGGTSLPELATSVVAAYKKNSGIAIGNVVGSNLFNIFGVLGVSATVAPLNLGGITMIDMAVLIASSVLFWLVALAFKKRTITRLEGIALIICYIVYTVYLISQGS